MPYKDGAAGIYVIVNRANGKFYLGSTVRLVGRHRYHLWLLRKQRHPNHPLQNAWNKYGSESFEWVVLAHIDRADLRTTEQRLLDKLHGRPICYNIANDSRSPAMTPSVRRKIGDAQRGRPRSQEYRDKIAASLRGRPSATPPETRAEAGRKSSAKQKGRVFSAEHRERMSAAAKVRGARLASDPERLAAWREKMAAGLARPESRAKLIAARQGRVVSDETRRKLSESGRGRKQSPAERAMNAHRAREWWATKSAEERLAWSQKMSAAAKAKRQQKEQAS